METITLNKFQKFFILFGGGDPQTVERTTSAERARMVTMGMTLLIPVLMGTMSGGYAIYFLTKQPSSFVFGILLGIVIYLIDRAVISMTSKSIWIIIIRIIMALVVGLVISFPIKLKIFEDSITEQLDTEKMVNVESIQKKYKSQIEQIDSSILDEQKKVKDLRDAYFFEMDGSGGTKERGIGEIATRKEAEYLAQKSKTDTFVQNKENEKQELRTKEKDEIDNKNKTQARSLIGQWGALGRVSEHEPFVKIASMLLWAFFTLLELLPLLVKIAGKGSLYDETVASDSQSKLTAIEQTNVEKAQAEIIATSVIIKQKNNAAKLALTKFDLDLESDKSKLVVEKIIEMSRNENRTIKEMEKLGHLSPQSIEKLIDRISNVTDFYTEKVYKIPFEKDALYDMV